ncbi:MAG: DUF503 domain-containing protein [Phycisphaeraceae bacterium]|nr:DUF503 domain-containing protein [Phycisphaeraceae bacterium]
MFVGLLQFELFIPHSASLKDKRRVVRSLRDRLHREHLVAVAETDANDRCREAVMGLACVSNSAAHVERTLDAIERKLGRLPEAELAWSSRDVIRGDQPPEGWSIEPAESLWDERDRRAESDEPRRAAEDAA